LSEFRSELLRFGLSLPLTGANSPPAQHFLDHDGHYPAEHIQNNTKKITEFASARAEKAEQTNHTKQ
jgi:hypothetical protein